MASSSSNSKELHNLPQPDLKPSKNPSTNHIHGRKSHSLSDLAPLQNTGNSIRSSENQKANAVEDSRKATSSSSLQYPMERPKKFVSLAEIMERPVAKTKTLVCLKMKQKVPEKEENIEKAKSEPTVDESFKRTWNLRTRKLPKKKSTSEDDGKQKSNPSLAHAGEKEADLLEKTKPKKPAFSISLTREEINEDFLAMTGAKPSRKPQKRSKNVQKQLENLFPGVRLASVNSDSYKSLPKGF